MQHPDYKKPLQFRNVHSFVPQTPNLEEIKRTNMKLKCQKAQENQLKILTPRSTRNLHAEREKKKSFRNLSLVLDCDQEDTCRKIEQIMPESRELTQFTQNHQNHQNKVSFHMGIHYDGKQNFGIGKENLVMKKKPRQSNTIQFKEVKSLKNKRINDEKYADQLRVRNKQMNQFSNQTYQGTQPQNREENLYKINILPYANDFESSTYQNHYKASTLASFKETLNEFSSHLSNAQIQLGSNFTSRESMLQNSIQQINDQFQKISLKLTQLHQQAINQVTDYINQMKTSYKLDIKQLHDIRKSIIRYQTDINLHYEDIVRELEFKCFEDIMAQYGNKLQYFQEEVKWILDQKDHHQPNFFMHNIKKLWRNIEKIELKYGNSKSSSDRDIENNFIRKPQQLILDEKTVSRKAS